MSQTFVCTSSSPIADTCYGRVRGFQLGSTYHFYGIPYATAARWQKPRKPEPWDGARDALSYGYTSPLHRAPSPNGDLYNPHRFWPQSEDCLNLNIWTQSLKPSAKKPVMVWIHGGGFSSGSSVEMWAYDGKNMSELADVVVVSINHRLNILGYLDVSPFGQRFQGSGNDGMLDIIASLEWIRDNIASFGGDPQNVTLFGQSGGGNKIAVLLQMPGAAGLFHKAIIQSGVPDPRSKHVKGDGREIVSAMMDYLGLAEIGELEKAPYEDLCRAYNALAPGFRREGKYVGCDPFVNEDYLGDPTEVGFTEFAKTVPTIVGSTFAEVSFGVAVPEKNSLPDSRRRELLEEKFGGHTDEMIRLFQKAYPDKNIVDLLYIDQVFRRSSIDFIEERSRWREAPVYSYVMAYEFPVMEGKPAWHCADIPFVFHNVEMVPACNVPGVSDRLQEEMFGAWVSFAKTGDPNHRQLISWPSFTPERKATMVFDQESRVAMDFDKELFDKERAYKIK